MSTTHAMPKDDAGFLADQSYNEEMAYLLSGRSSAHRHSYATVGIILLHDPQMNGMFLEQALRNYTAVYSDRIMCACRDGSMISESTQSMFPEVCFFSMSESAESAPSVGALLNVLFSEIDTDLVFVSWTSIDPYGISTRTLLSSAHEVPLCIAPVFENGEGELIPLAYKPELTPWGLSVSVGRDILFFPYTFMPHDFVGIYNRKKFLELCGFDSSISDPFWQLCDFGLRAYAKGDAIRFSSYYRVRRNAERPTEPVLAPKRAPKKVSGKTSAKTLQKKFASSQHNYFYHLLCFKYRLGLRLVHGARCMLHCMAQWAAARFFKKRAKGDIKPFRYYRMMLRQNSIPDMYKAAIKKQIAAHW